MFLNNQLLLQTLPLHTLLLFFSYFFPVLLLLIHFIFDTAFYSCFHTSTYSCTHLLYSDLLQSVRQTVDKKVIVMCQRSASTLKSSSAFLFHLFPAMKPLCNGGNRGTEIIWFGRSATITWLQTVSCSKWHMLICTDFISGWGSILSSHNWHIWCLVRV